MTAHSGRRTAHRRWAVLLIGALAAALSLLAVPAGALPLRGESHEAANVRTATSGPIIPPGPAQSIVGPRYTVELVSFKALDESHADWWGSDTVFGLFGSNSGYHVRTSKEEGVDSGDTRNFESRERCLTRQRVLSGSPDRGWLIGADGTRWECDPRGVAAPIELWLELFEDDGCNPYFPSCFNTYVPPVRDPADDLIGLAEPIYTAGELASRLRQVGDTYVTSFTLGGPCGYQPPGHVCGSGPLSATGPEYRLTIMIRRVDDARPVFTP